MFKYVTRILWSVFGATLIFPLSVVIPLQEIFDSIRSYNWILDWRIYISLFPLSLIGLMVIIKNSNRIYSYFSTINNRMPFDTRFDSLFAMVLLAFFLSSVASRFGYLEVSLAWALELLFPYEMIIGGVYLIWLCKRCFQVHSLNGINATNETNEIKSYSDHPIVSATADEFRRTHFAAQMSTIIEQTERQESLVVGLYAKWGMGKSSTINLIKEKFAKKNEVIVLDFNPWIYEGEKELIRSFLTSLVGKFQEFDKPELVKLLKNYSERVAPIEINLGILTIPLKSILGNKNDGTDLNDLRSKITKLLAESKKRIVVFIDDVDRLDEKETHAVFKLVKVVAAFPYISYVMAFDEELTSKVLDKYYPGEGESFIDKIIQIPLHLPVIDNTIVRDFILSSIEKIFKGNNIELAEELTSEVVNRWDSTFGCLTITPREAKRFLNSLIFSLPLLKNEVNVSDQIFLEGLRVFFPNVYQMIRMNRNYILKAHVGVMIDLNQDDALRAFDNATNNLEIEKKNIAIKAVKTLFPRAVWIWSNNEAQWSDTWVKEKRVCTVEYFSRYFRYTIPLGDIADEKIEILENQLLTCPIEEVESQVAILIKEGGASTISKLRMKEDNFSPTQAEKLAKIIVKLGSQFSDVDPILGYRFYSNRGQAAILVSKLIKKLPLESRSAITKEIMTTDDSIDFLIGVFYFLAPGVEKSSTEEIQLSDSELRPIAQQLISTVMSSGADKDLFTKSSNGDLRYLLWVCKRWGSSKDLEGIVDMWLESPDGLERLLLAFFASSFDLERNYRELEEVISPEKIADLLNKKYGESREPRNDILIDFYGQNNPEEAAIYRFWEAYNQYRINSKQTNILPDK